MYSNHLLIKSEASVTLDARVFRDEAAIVMVKPRSRP